MTRLPLVLLLAGCSKGPLSGTWLYGSSEILSDSCDLLEDTNLPNGDFYVYNQGDGTMVIDPNDDSEIFTCTLDKDTFDCPDRVQEERTQGQTTITALIAVRGTFADRETASGSQIGTFTCAGPACADLETFIGQPFPCDAEIGFTATWTSPTVPE